jgi:hypothetical protein
MLFAVELVAQQAVLKVTWVTALHEIGTDELMLYDYFSPKGQL